MDYEHIVALVREVSQAGLSHFEYTEGNIHISMGCRPKEALPASEGKAETALAAVPGEMTAGTTSSSEGTASKAAAAAPEADAGTAGAAEDLSVHSNVQTVTSPLVGTFYSAPSENAESFVKVGDRVEKGQTLAIVEAMKLMNEIESDYAGIVTEILAENESPVEYGQPLFKIAQ